MEQGKLFKVDESFIFAVQIPDDSVGCSGSRCSNCNGAVAYCDQRCEHCGFPFVGPFSFPQLPRWNLRPLDEKRKLIEDAYARDNRGRLGYTNVAYVPLTPIELEKIEKLTGHDAETFTSVHGISPQKIRETLFK